MAVSPYRVTPARIGNSSGLRLPAAFYRDHPQFAGAAGQVEVLDDSTLLLRVLISLLFRQASLGGMYSLLKNTKNMWVLHLMIDSVLH